MRITASGFQSHESLSLDLRGRLVCVTGPNNVGKSAVIRAARWVFYDALRGSKFIKKGRDSAQVTIEADGSRVTRVKSRKTSERNAYLFGDRALESIGTGAPPEVEEALGVRRVAVDKDLELELNVVGQKEHPFLMDETGTAKSKVLNALTGLHVLDVAIRQTAALLRSLRAREKSLAEQGKALEGELAAFADLPGKEATVAEARADLERIIAADRRNGQARADLAALASSREELDRLRAKPVPDMAGIDSLSAAMDAAVTRAVSMRADLAALSAARRDRDALRGSPLGSVDMASLEALLASHLAAEERREGLRRQANVLSFHVSDVSAKRSQLERSEGELRGCLAELSALVGTACGECGRPLDAQCLEAVA